MKKRKPNPAGTWKTYYCVLKLWKDDYRQLKVKEMTRWDRQRHKVFAKLKILHKQDPKAQYQIISKKFHEKPSEIPCDPQDVINEAKRFLRLHRVQVPDKREALLRDQGYRDGLMLAAKVVMQNLPAAEAQQLVHGAFFGGYTPDELEKFMDESGMRQEIEGLTAINLS